MEILAIIQARISSTRLPKKVLLDLEGKTVLEHVVDRVNESKKIEEIVVATTLNKEDTEIVKICTYKNVRVFCGSENDVLDRFYQIGKLLKPIHIVRITADCPIIDPEIIDKTIDLHLLTNSDYTSNQINETFPDGLDTEVFTFDSLLKAWKETTLLSDREHVTPYIRNHRDIFKVSCLDNKENLSSKRWTLDEPQDYEFIKIIFKNIYPEKPNFRMRDILKFLKNNPEIEKINQHIASNEGYAKSLKENKVVTKTEAE